MISKFVRYAGTSALALLFSAPALAQAQTADAAPEAEADSTAEVVITGSRIARKDYVAESPIVTVGAETIQNSGTPALEDTLNRLPQFAGSSTGQSSSSTQRGGRANLNLRGLGIARTLVLLDGRRLQPSDPLGAIDMNTITASLIGDVEVITGGASAVYGSDAIAGVVNFKLKRDFTGLQADATYGISDENDAQTQNYALTWGADMDEGRGNVALAFTYFQRDGLLRSDRRYFDDHQGTSVPASGTYTADATNLPTQAAVNNLFNTVYGSPNTVNRNGLYSQNPDGTIYEQRSGANFRWPSDSMYYRASTGAVFVRTDPQSLLQDLERYSFFGKANYDITSNIEAYGQYSYTHYTTEQVSNGILMATTAPVYVSVNNSSVPTDMRTLLASRPRPNDPFLYYSTGARMGPSTFKQTYNVQQYTGGLRGDVGLLDWTWDVSASYGRTEVTEDLDGYWNRAAFQTLLSAADAGASICAGGYQVFSYLPISEACRRYLKRDVRNFTTFDQTTIDASVQGGLFDTWAGEVRYAAGVNFRRNSYDANIDQQLTFQTVMTGAIESSQGSTEAIEFFGEMLIPLIKDVPLIDEFNLNIAYRRSDYDTIGAVNTYKASGEWQVFPSLMIRSGYQRAIRAPSVGELYAARRFYAANIGTIASGAGDPCNIVTSYRTGPNAAQVRALCLATGVPAGLVDSYNFIGTAVAGSQVGNPNLTEETADSVTAGFVWRPKFDVPAFSRLSLSVDYFNIDIQNAIGSISTAVSLQRCFNGDGGSNPTYSPTNYYCTLIERDTQGTPTRSLEPTANLARYKTTGVDVQFDWRVDGEDVGLPEGFGSLSLNSVVSYVQSYEIQNLASSPLLDYAGTIGNAQIDAESLSHPRWKSVTTVGWEHGPVQLSLGWRFIDSMTNSLNVGATNPTGRGVGAMNYYDATARWDIDETSELRIGVVNLTDKQPPVWTGFAATDPSTYDLVQRRFFIGMSKKF